MSENTVERVRQCFSNDSKQSLRRAAAELQLAKSSVHRILHNELGFSCYKIQVLQELKLADYGSREDFAFLMLEKNAQDPDFLSRVIFSDEATFCLSGKVNRQNLRIWSTENPHEFRQHIRDTPRLNVWCAMARNQIIGPFFLWRRP